LPWYQVITELDSEKNWRLLAAAKKKPNWAALSKDVEPLTGYIRGGRDGNGSERKAFPRICR